MTDLKRALLGDHEAAKRLTEQGVLLPCPGCGESHEIAVCIQERILLEYYGHCWRCGWYGPIRQTEKEARLAWNTRAPILSAEEMEMLDERSL